MKSAFLVSAALSAVSHLAHASPLSLRADEPCGQLREAVDKWYSDNKIVRKPRTPALVARVYPGFPAAPVLPSLAFACLRSVPLDKETAIKHIDFLRPQFQWHSAVDILKDPPYGYLSEGVDLIGGLEQIKAKLEGDAYRTEFDFLADLHILANVRVRDEHFHAGSAMLDLFTFKTGAEFVSVSADGVALPEIFVQEDIKHDMEKYRPSAVSTIDGIPALDYLKRESLLAGGSHDPDARFNEVTWSLAQASTYFSTESGTHILGLNDTTTVQFQNKTVRIFSNTAFVRADLTNVTSAESLYHTYGLNGTAPLPHPWTAYQRAFEHNFTPSWSGYPASTNRTPNGGAAGFLPTSPGLKDTVVLVVNTFDNALDPADNSTYNFPEWRLWNMTAAVLTRARAENRTKLILDMQGNTGGAIATMTALLFALFPPAADPFPFLFQVRAHPQLAWIVDRVTATAGANDTRWAWEFNPKDFLVPYARTPFSSMAEWYGPPYAEEPHVTPPFAWNLTRYMDPWFWPRLSPANAPFTTQWFRTEDITILTDGVCGSGCAILVDTLSRLHGVKTVAVGGRPMNAPMQAIGRVRGGPVINFGAFDSVRGRGWEVPEGLELAKSSDGMPLRMTGQGTAFNLMNMIDPNEEGLPTLQFMWTPADCRVWWTWGMGREVERVWERVREVAWGGGKCVEGSTGRTHQRLGYKGYAEGVQDEVKLGPGPGSLEK